MKVLIVGSGGREHALQRSVLASRSVTRVFSAPGNGGMELDSVCVPLQITDIEGLAAFALREKVDLTVVGPELPLSLGIVDTFVKNGLPIFGPTKAASILEGSKIFTKEFCQRHCIPTAGFKVFTDVTLARNYIAEKNIYPLVIKADGLAAGKGVFVAMSQEEAMTAVTSLLVAGQLGEAGRKILVEDFLLGQELSCIVVADGRSFVSLPAAKDHKRLLDNDQGPNTGGMGAYAPVPLLTHGLEQKIIQRIIEPTLNGMIEESRSYRGFLYAGLMVLPNGDPYLLEYNCRLGDPEAQVILPLLKSDLVALMTCAIEGQLKNTRSEFFADSVVGVTLVGAGYPGVCHKGLEIVGLDKIEGKDVWVIHAGTKRAGDGFVTDSGRVLTVVARAPDLQAAADKVYVAAAKVSFRGRHYRRDIGRKGFA